MFHELPKDSTSVSTVDTQPFRIVTIYDSAAASLEAARASAVMLRELGDDVPVDRSSWNVRALADDSISNFAAAEAARADVIVIALSAEGSDDLLKKWITRWEGGRRVKSGLLALIPAESKGVGYGLADYLAEVALTAEMDFLCRKQKRF